MKKSLLALIIAIIALVLLFPARLEADDGGTILYDAILYNYYKVKQMASPEERANGKMYYEGIVLEILGFEVYNDVK